MAMKTLKVDTDASYLVPNKLSNLCNHLLQTKFASPWEKNIFCFLILHPQKRERSVTNNILFSWGKFSLCLCIQVCKITLSMHIRILSSVLIKSHSNIFASSWKNVAQYILVNEKICFKVLPSFSVSINFEKPHSWLPYSLQKSKSTCFTRALWSKWAYEFQS